MAIALPMGDPIERFLAALRGSHPDMAHIYTHGACFELFLILRQLWPQARPWSDLNHVWTEIDGRFYDINGRHLRVPIHTRPMDDVVMRRARRWSRRTFCKQKGTHS